MLEAIVVLLALPTLSTLGHSPTGPGLAAILALAVALVVASGLLRRPAGVALGSVLQVLVLAAGTLAWPLFVLGLAFGGLWVGYLRLMRDLRTR